MKKFHVLSDAQMARLLEQQGGGAIDVEAEMRLPRLRELNAELERLLRSGDAQSFSRFKLLRNELLRLHDWFKAREDPEAAKVDKRATPIVRVGDAQVPVEPELHPILPTPRKPRRIKGPVHPDLLHTPRRTRSKGKPSVWRTIDRARALEPKLKRI